ncbi:hypothetical protein [Latilactobacillus fuchuensis]|jgi:hypothetical protein|uniref:Uncharacterized protein n=1 Tax=Latilactobacillus fuchuensis DSM 14340 = JCM 11249 TaxID=1423747 RepID=A0A0R1RPE5_9LACO|nr:hypothetical protein [Latilactobacillus fuchuensis]KRL58545.1 hypothetical protein FC69_GL000195 [Latilactobacillus fuchuensis DSM 14340 = JCM 11249]MCP8857226.1 hypothetical protein [Latilactobacillus fuchuensis]
MTIRDYFHAFSTVSEQAEAYDYLIQFISDTPADLHDYPKITQICDWATYTKNSFRIWTDFPIPEFESRFVQLTGINPSDFQIDYSHNFKDSNFF